MRGRDCVIAIDIGGTQVKGFRFTDGRKEASAVRATDAARGLAGITAAVTDTVRTLWTDGVQGVGIASAGTIDAVQGKVLYATDNLPEYSGFDWNDCIGKLCGVPCAAINDAQAALLGELRYGKAGDRGRVAMLTLGTGVGGAFAADGKIDFGAFCTGHAYGHYMLYADGKPCNCGCRGCVERYISGTALHERLREHGVALNDFCAVETACRAGETSVRNVVEAFADDLVKTIDGIALADTPDVVLVGGGVAERCPSVLEIAAPRCHVPIKPATLGNTAGIYGAYAYWLQRFAR